jgi:hypothetical protein
MSRERLTVGKGGVLNYHYRAGEEMDFSFHMLCEVGEPYQQWFRDEIRMRGYRVQYGAELDRAPWVADRVVGTVGNERL